MCLRHPKVGNLVEEYTAFGRVCSHTNQLTILECAEGSANGICRYQGLTVFPLKETLELRDVGYESIDQGCAFKSRCLSKVRFPQLTDLELKRDHTGVLSSTKSNTAPHACSGFSHTLFSPAT